MDPRTRASRSSWMAAVFDPRGFQQPGSEPEKEARWLGVVKPRDRGARKERCRVGSECCECCDLQLRIATAPDRIVTMRKGPSDETSEPLYEGRRCSVRIDAVGLGTTAGGAQDGEVDHREPFPCHLI
eukprot:725304-Rhodomonas_salina.1